LTAVSARVSAWLDDVVWGGLVQAVSLLTVWLSWLNRLIDEFVVNFGFDKGCGSLRNSGGFLSRFQNGQVQRYMRVIGLALAILALIFIWGCK
jgi:NADH-quinone oxidoreductase subunit L